MNAVIPRLKIKINKEYQDLVPPLTDQEYQGLRQSIKEKGLWIPIIVNGQGIVLDGHHRSRACQELGIEPRALTREFENQNYEALFIIDCNLKRRHLNRFQRVELALKSKPILERIAETNSNLNLKQNKQDSPSVEIRTVGRVDKEIGRRAGTGKDTVRKVESVLQSGNSDLIERARSEKLTINKAFGKVRRNNKRQEMIREAKEVIIHDTAKLLLGDFREVCKEFPDNSIDLILTDPPYGINSIPLYTDLA